MAKSFKMRVFSGVVIFLFCAYGATLIHYSSQKDQPDNCSVRNTINQPVFTVEEKASVDQAAVAGNNGADVADIFEIAQPLSSHALINQLKDYGLWDLSGKKEVVPMVVPGFPVNLQHLDVASKKKAFFHTLLPVAHIALRELAHERQQLLAIAEKLPSSSRLDDTDRSWMSVLTTDEHVFIGELAEKYRSADIDELLSRVDGLPVSLILAQGAIESSWGTSRFAVQGKNLFGVWTWGERGMVPNERLAGKTHKVAVYDSILDSVRNYLLTLNRHAAYEEFRTIRLQTSDPLQLAEGLKRYSERGAEYISDVQMMIDFNKLQRFDRFQLAGQSTLSFRKS